MILVPADGYREHLLELRPVDHSEFQGVAVPPVSLVFGEYGVRTDNAQIVLVDTPGIDRPRTLLGQRLNDVVDESLSDVDAIAFLLPADQEIGPGG